MILRTSKIYWDPDDAQIQRIIKNDVDVKTMSVEDTEHLIKELDRRLIQLWDKVQFENKKK